MERFSINNKITQTLIITIVLFTTNYPLYLLKMNTPPHSVSGYQSPPPDLYIWIATQLVISVNIIGFVLTFRKGSLHYKSPKETPQTKE